MPAKDETAWKQNEDGSWSRRRGEIEETTSEDPYGPDATSGAVEAAAELGVDINSIEGSGKDGKVTKADVEAAAATNA